ncbi:MAG: DsbA family protein [Chthoniobacterales bacterium]
MKRILPFGIILLVAVVACGAGYSLYRSKLETVFAPIPGELSSAHPGAQPPHFRGSARAPVVIEEFGDLQCPPCSLLAGFLKQIEEDYRGKVRLVFRQHPLAMHAHAVEAARASEAAGLQGRFWEMADLLYETQNSWAKEAKIDQIFEQDAQKIGLDVARYKADLDSQAVLSRIGLDEERGKSLQVISTPTLFLNNQRVAQQFMNPTSLREAVDALVHGKKPFPVEATTPTPAPAQTATPTP